MDSELVQRGSAALLEADVQGLIGKWLDYEREENENSDNTIATYRRGLAVFVRWLAGYGGGQVTPAMVATFKKHLKGAYSVQTVNARLTAVRRFYAWMVVTGRLPYSPASEVKGLKRSKSKSHKRDALTNGELLAVLNTCAPFTPEGKRDNAILVLMAYCGLRTVEVHRADIGDLRTRKDRLTLDVQGKGRTSKDDFVVIPVDQERVIRGWLSDRLTFKGHGPDDPLFISLSNRNRGQRMGLRGIRGMVKARYAQAGVVGRKTTHSLRHSAITNAIRRGATPMQAQAMARHGSIDTTLGYYHEVSRVDNPAEDMIDYEVVNGGA